MILVLFLFPIPHSHNPGDALPGKGRDERDRRCKEYLSVELLAPSWSLITIILYHTCQIIFVVGQYIITRLMRVILRKVGAIEEGAECEVEFTPPGPRMWGEIVSKAIESRTQQ